MVFQAWPFLVSSNRALGYRAIVAPDFMVTGKTAHLLAELTEGTLSEPGTAICRRIHHAQTGNLTLIYRIANATEGETVLTDGFGRPINWVSGLVMKGHPADISVTQEHFEEVHRHVEAPFREFWQQTSSQPAFPSNLITLKTEGDQADSLTLVKFGDTQGQTTDSSHTPTSPFPQENLWKYKGVLKTRRNVCQLLFSPTQDILAILSVSTGGVFYVDWWNCRRNESVSLVSINGFSDFSAIEFHPDGKKFVGIERDNRASWVMLWEPSQWGRWHSKEQTAAIKAQFRDVKYSPNQRFLACGAEDGHVYLWDRISARWSWQQGHVGRVGTVAFSPDGCTIASGGEDGQVVLWTVSAGSLEPYPRVLPGDARGIHAVAFTPDGSLVVGARQDGRIRIWDIAGNFVRGTLEGHTAAVNALCFLPDHTLLSGSADGSVRVWDINATRETRMLGQHASAVISVACDRTGQRVASASNDSTNERVRIWERPR